MSRQRSVMGVRWREDTGFELRCEDCAAAGRQSYWPLDLEFWNPHTFVRCRACDKARRARRIAERRAADPEWYQSHLADVRATKRYKNAQYNRTYRERRKAREEAA